MVDIPNIRIPDATGIRPTQATSPVSLGKSAPAGKSADPKSAVGAISSKAETPFQAQELEAHMPISILVDSILTRTEWGWRRLLVDFMEDRTLSQEAPVNQGPQLESNTHSGALTTTDPYAQTIAAARSAIDNIARMPDQRLWTTVLPGTAAAPHLVPFAQIDHHALQNTQTAHLQPWVLLDRLTAAVQDAQAPVFGGGMLVAPSNNLASSVAVRWKAHCSSHSDANGQTVHRLVLDLRLRERPTRVTVVSMHPQLAIHLESDDIRLQSQVETDRSVLQEALNKNGWSLHNLTTGPYQNNEG